MKDPVVKGHPLHAMLSDLPIGITGVCLIFDLLAANICVPQKEDQNHANIHRSRSYERCWKRVAHMLENMEHGVRKVSRSLGISIDDEEELLKAFLVQTVCMS